MSVCIRDRRPSVNVGGYAGHPPRRHGRVLRVGRVARAARVARPAGGRRRRRRPRAWSRPRRTRRGPTACTRRCRRCGAQRLCPQAIFLAGDHARYARGVDAGDGDLRVVHAAGRAASLDEAFLDVHRVACASSATRRRSPIASATGARPRRGWRCSVGVAPNKFLAKLASEAAKPEPRRRMGRCPGSASWWSSRASELAVPAPAAGAGRCGASARPRWPSSNGSA